MAFFFFLPSPPLSGYMFPFRGMPDWAQDIGECLPLTHFLRVVRGILLKGNGLAECLPDLWPIALFLAVMLTIGIKRYRQSLIQFISFASYQPNARTSAVRSIYSNGGASSGITR